MQVLNNLEAKELIIQEFDKASELEQPKDLNSLSIKKAVEPNKRLIALLIDLIVCYLASVLIFMVVSLIPFLSNFFPQPLILTLIFMSRDYFFNGRGFGKNLMGLQVVSTIGAPITLIQSFLRNLTLTAALLVLELAALVPATVLPAFIRDILNIAEAIYAIIVLPLESYRAYTREDSLRLGDVLAGTKIVQAQTNFDHLLPGRKN